MNKLHILSLVCLALGIFILFFGLLSGDYDIGVFVFVPFFYGAGIYHFLGFELIIISIFLFMFGYSNFYERDEFQTKNSEYGTGKKTLIRFRGGIIIGPIPIIFSSNWKILFIFMIIAIVMYAFFFIKIA